MTTMRHLDRWSVIALVVAGVGLAGCGGSPTGAAPASFQAVAEPIEGTNLKKVSLTQRAAERLGIQLVEAREEQVAGQQRLVVPYAAVLYDAKGTAWAYTNPEGLVFIRQSLTIEFIQGDLAVLSAGPPLGTRVVTIGAAELYGVESGVGGVH